MPKEKILDFAAVREIGLALSDVKETTIRGEPALRVSGRLLTCPALHRSAEPNSIVVHIDLDERRALLAARPDVYYVTEHYKHYPAILVRLSHIERGPLKQLLMSAWRFARFPAKMRRAK